MSVFLCGNTGIVNRGCEAIIRSTVKVLDIKYQDVYLASDYYQADYNLARELGLNFIPYNTINKPQMYISKIDRLLNRKSLEIERILQAHLFYNINKGDLCLNIGGDTYCYGRPIRSLGLNKFANKKGADTILWCCSIEKSAINEEIKKDLNRYKYIFARESITEENLLNVGVSKEHIIKVCDPAFFLDKKETVLPDVFKNGDTVGINLSELVVRPGEKQVYDSVIELINYIIHKTELNVCLIPHVYDINRNICDWPIISKIVKEINNPRVGIVDKELNCEELKYIISHCRFFFAARTHASIAAYSSYVPTVVLGYSVKSKGIAKDIFGTDKNYVVPYDSIKNNSVLIDSFIFLAEHEQEIKSKLFNVIPGYKQLLLDAIDKYITIKISDDYICESNLCTGCFACFNSCNVNAIEKVENEFGFLYPHINTALCLHCNKCREVCPVLHKKKDDLITPECFGLINKDNHIREASSSGGVFYLIANEILKLGGVVFGAAYDEKLRVHHIGVSNTDDLMKLLGSKYVQSDLENTYYEAKTLLENDVYVLYSGTPCQIEGLKAYLGKDYAKLYTQDLICHGVPSPKIWQEYLNYIEKKNNCSILKANFRCKEKGWTNQSISLTLSSGKKYNELLNDSIYFKGYINNYTIRKSCYECSFRKINRISDITLADYWGIQNVDSNMFDNKGTSLVFIQSNKGRELIDLIKNNCLIQAYDYNIACKSNPSYNSYISPSPYQSDFEIMTKNKGLIKALVFYNNVSKHKFSYFTGLLSKWSWKK